MDGPIKGIIFSFLRSATTLIKYMLDLIYIGIIIAFFLVALGYIAACEALNNGSGK